MVGTIAKAPSELLSGALISNSVTEFRLEKKNALNAKSIDSQGLVLRGSLVENCYM